MWVRIIMSFSLFLYSFFAVSEFEVLYRLEETYDPSMSMYDIVSGTCYDHIWVAAIALNCTDAYLKSIGQQFICILGNHTACKKMETSLISLQWSLHNILYCVANFED